MDNKEKHSQNLTFAVMIVILIAITTGAIWSSYTDNTHPDKPCVIPTVKVIQTTEYEEIKPDDTETEIIDTENTEIIENDLSTEGPETTEDVKPSSESNSNDNISNQNNELSDNDPIVITDSKQKYQYCPVGINDNGSLRTFWCENKNSGEIRDHIYTNDGIALSPGPGWDSVHVCDPSVIQGNFQYNGTSYRYLMAYLGCNTLDNQNNQIGLAASNSYGGPWTKIGSEPFIKYSYDYDHADCFQWGIGQPSLININDNGKIAIFYTKGTYNLTSEQLEIYDLSDLSRPVQLASTTVSSRRLKDFISNADFAYNKNTGELYMISDTHPYDGIVTDKVRVAKTIIDFSNINTVSSCKWNIVRTIDKSVTGFDKNHNAGFIRDPFGYVNGEPEVLCTVSSDDLWSYRFEKI